MEKKETFTKIGFIMAALGMAIGTGNLWRFPRMVTKYGGGAFILAWIIFLFIWAIPLLMIEFSIGNKFKKGLIGAFKEGMGEKYAWMGAFVGLVSTAILFYYSVVTGWCIKYFFTSVFDFNSLIQGADKYWEAFTSGPQPVFFNTISLLIGGFIIVLGVSKGIEKVNRIMIPTLFVILVLGVIRAVTLPGGAKGLEYLFSADFSKLKDFNVWINALSQSAWSTGAGWGLVLTLSVYTTKKDNPVSSSATIGFGNCSASLLAGMVVVPTVFFALQGNEQKLFEVLSQGNQGLTFIAVPALFNGISMGQIFLALFFLALCFAAFSSLLAMIELPTRILMDTGISRKKSTFMVIATSFLFGIPSAISITFFNNQDTTWGYGLILSGFFFALFAIKFGVKKFRVELLGKDSNWKMGKIFDIIVKYVIPIEFLILIGWCLYSSYTSNSFTLIIIFSQWIFFLILFRIFNNYLAKKVKK